MKVYFWAALIVLTSAVFLPVRTLADDGFNPNFIISDQVLTAANTWGKQEIQDFLTAKGSFLSTFVGPNANGERKTAAEIIYDAAQTYVINPKFLLVTLQKEQSLITDDKPSQRQLDWATGYAVCDGCMLSDPKVQRNKGFGKQVEGAAAIMRWYYDNQSLPIVKKINSPIVIDEQTVTPGSWATAFLYTYTPHLHGNKNFWRIWNAWFSMSYPNGSLLQSIENKVYWLIENDKRRPFSTKTALVSRVDPKTAIPVHDIDLAVYPTGTPIAFSNYSILRSASTTYLLDYDTLRPFESDAVVRAIGYNPDEILDVDADDLIGYATGTVITASTTAPAGVIYQITDLNNRYYLLKDGLLTPITDRSVIDINYQRLAVEKHTRAELAKYTLADKPIAYRDGTLLRAKDGTNVYVVEHGQRRRIADSDTFIGLGYKYSNVVGVTNATLVSIPEGEPIYANASLISSAHKFLGDAQGVVEDRFSTPVSSYLVAEYPSGRILAGKKIDDRFTLASLTKLLTLHEVLSRKWDGKKKVTFTTSTDSDDTLRFKKGDVITADDLLKAVLIASSNASAEMIPQAVGTSRSDILDTVRSRLEDWGADATAISDLSGLNPSNKSSARDLLAIATKVFTNKELVRQSAISSASVRVSKGPNAGKVFSLKNTNQLITAKHPEYKIIASKTGYLEDSGHNMIMLIELTKTKKQYMIVTLGNRDYAKRFSAVADLAARVATTDFSKD